MLKAITESLERKPLTLTEAFNSTFPGWLKSAMVKSRKGTGMPDYRQQTSTSWGLTYRGRDYVPGQPDYKVPRGVSSQEDYDFKHGLFYNSLNAGLFDAIIHEASVPKKASDPILKDSDLLPIWGLIGGQVYIPGFNDKEKFNYYNAYIQNKTYSSELLTLASKVDGKAFEDISTKMLGALSVHFAYCDRQELNDNYSTKFKQRRQRDKEEADFHTAHPEYINYGSIDRVNAWANYRLPSELRTKNVVTKQPKTAPAARGTNPMASFKDLSTLGYQDWRHQESKVDASGYLVTPSRYVGKLDTMRAKNAGKKLTQFYDYLVDAENLLQASIHDFDIKHSNPSYLSKLNSFRNALRDAIKDYNECALALGRSQEGDTSVGEKVTSSTKYHYKSLDEYLQYFNDDNRTGVDWLV